MYTHTQNDGLCQRDTGASEKTPNAQSWKNMRNKINKVVSDYNPKYNKYL